MTSKFISNFYSGKYKNFSYLECLNCKRFAFFKLKQSAICLKCRNLGFKLQKPIKHKKIKNKIYKVYGDPKFQDWIGKPQVKEFVDVQKPKIRQKLSWKAYKKQVKKEEKQYVLSKLRKGIAKP